MMRTRLASGTETKQPVLSRVRQLLAPRRIVPWVVFVLTVGLLVAHSLGWKRIHVDGITLALLGGLLVVPSWDRVRRLKWGDFEAEIAPAEVKRVQAEASAQVGPPVPRGDDTEFRTLYETLRSDPTLGLAGIRIELERLLRALKRVSGPGLADRRTTGAGQLASDLARAGVLSPQLASTLSQVLSIANRAIHGEAIREEDAQTLGTVGIQLIDELQDLYLDTATEPIETETITAADRDHLMHEQLYRVVTVVPLVEQPKRNVRILDQAALDDFLEGYSEYAEFLVSIEPYGPPKPN